MPHSDKAMIFDIINGSFVDGPGIRTTVFFKGCNLRCKWCHNPEGISEKQQLMIFKNKCRGCGKCAEVCKNAPCILCGRCVEVCPNDARKICGGEYSVDEVFEKIIKNKAFYDASGGGVTCSGGECMLQIEFLTELLRHCKQEGIHTAVDTAGNVPTQCFERVLPYADLFLYDIKCIDKSLHKSGTGADNALILKNYIFLVKHAEVCVRVPVIGGFNDNMQELQSIAGFLKQYPPASVELLPYHAMGEHKYDALGKTNERFSKPSDEIMRSAQEMIST